MAVLSFDLIQTIGLAVIVLLAGVKIRERASFLQRYFIPAPVVGGLVFSVVTLLGHESGLFSVKLDQGLNTFLMVMFFTCTGFMASIRVIRRSGRLGLTVSATIVFLLFLQNGIGIGLASLLGLHPLLGVSMGSVSFTGGIGSSVAFGPLFESVGVPNATLVGLAAATYGLFAGSLTGGPVAKVLIDRYALAPGGGGTAAAPLEEKDARPSSEKSIASSVFLVLLTMLLGTYLVLLLNKTGITFPYFVGGVFAAALVRNIADARGVRLRMAELNGIGNITLSLFLTLSLMSLEVWELFTLAVPMAVILGAQTAFFLVYVYAVVFRVTGRDYEAAVMAAGYCGVGLGQVPNVVANMATVIEKYGPAPAPWFMLPVISVILINMLNPFVITLLMNFLK
ncbi:Sodium/glutamate symporter [uncultured delta proteobacterium]|uniref:Sodium/glutamate symporter n=1 Tax=uncultured delta proteobacterium TaxID=34034 RepID=A0A212JCX2_9DELT|nr:Sodium/glutamate symporter [uncultured delta proteobacterium]